MSSTYVVTSEVLAKFKKPFGDLIKGTSEETSKSLCIVIEKDHPTAVIAVGDRVSRNLNKNKIPMQISITDNKSHRRKLRPQVFADMHLVKIKNPQGTITPQAIIAMQDAVKSKSSTQILVDGEEDLLTLIAVRFAPENAMVVYGQPHEGIVYVKVTPSKRKEAEEILKRMKTETEKPA